MPSLVASLEGTIARAGSQLGQWWPNAWWPTGNSKYNDCAAFVSWCLWGLNGNQPYQTIVSGIIERSGLEFHAGAAGIRRGDIAGFRWTLADNYDHTEIVLGPPNAQGFIQTIGANGGGSDKVAIHTRSTGYVHNYARPNYPTTGTAGDGSAPLDNGMKEVPMYVRRDSTGLVALFNGTGQHDFTSLDDYRLHRSILVSYNGVNPGDQQFVPPEDPAKVIGLDETAWPIVVAKYGAPHVAAGGTTPTDYYSDADAARDLKTITDAITAGDTSLLSAISQVDENTLATFGLKRA